MLISPTKILSRGLPKTGQTTSYHSGDDGEWEAGWWPGRLNQNNRTRFIEREYVAYEPVIIDLATGLMWPKNIVGPATYFGTTFTWPAAVDFCNNLNFGGFSDWRLCNSLEFLSLGNLNRTNPAAYTDVFDNWPTAEAFWSSTTRGTTTYADRVYLTEGFSCSGKNKTTSSYRVLPVRSI